MTRGRNLSRDCSQGGTLKHKMAADTYSFVCVSEKITMILLPCEALFYTLTVLVAGNRGEGISHVRADLAMICDLGHMRNSRLTSYESV